VVFGFRARREAGPASDIDLLQCGIPINCGQRHEGFKDFAREVSEDFACILALILAPPDEGVNVNVLKP
jgi:hypothetical protein